MAARPVKHSGEIKKFLRTLKKELHVEKIFLFGSHARGHATANSDIDLAVISKDFKGIPPLDRLVWLGLIAWKAGTPEIEAIGYTPQEFWKASPWEFPAEIKTNGFAIS